MAFYDNFYGNPGSSAVPKRTDEMRQQRQDFRQLRNQGVLGQGSTLDARMGDFNPEDTNLAAGPNSRAENKAAIQGLRQDTNQNGTRNYGDTGQPTYSTPYGIETYGMPAARKEDLAAFRDSMVNRFKNPNGTGGLLPNAPSWMSSDRANKILSNVSGRFNNSLPYNANPYQESWAKQGKGQPGG